MLDRLKKPHMKRIIMILMILSIWGIVAVAKAQTTVNFSPLPYPFTVSNNNTPNPTISIDIPTGLYFNAEMSMTSGIVTGISSDSNGTVDMGQFNCGVYSGQGGGAIDPPFVRSLDISNLSAPCLGAGTYNLLFQFGQDSFFGFPYDHFFVQVISDGTNLQIVAGDVDTSLFETYDTRILDASAVSYSTTTTTLNTSVDFFLNLPEISSTTPSRFPQNIRARYTVNRSSNFSTRQFTIPQPFTQGAQTLNDVTLDNVTFPSVVEIWYDFGNFTSFFDETNNPFPESYLVLEVFIDGYGIITSQEIIFTSTGQQPPSIDVACDQNGAIARVLCLVLVWAFVPSESVLENVFGVWESLRDVKPFGYIIQVIELRGDMELNTPAYDLDELPLKATVFDPIRAGLVVIFWVVFMFYLYNRFKSIDI